MGAEVRAILEDAVRAEARLKIGTAIYRIGQEAGGIDGLEVPVTEALRTRQAGERNELIS